MKAEETSGTRILATESDFKVTTPSHPLEFCVTCVLSQKDEALFSSQDEPTTAHTERSLVSIWWEIRILLRSSRLTAGEYWKQRSINSCADSNDFVCATRRINGGTNGLAARQQYLSRARAALGGAAIRDAQQAATADSGFPSWAIGAIVGGVVGLAAVVVVIVLVVRRQQQVKAPGQEGLLRSSEQDALARKSVMTKEFSQLSNLGTVLSLRKQ